MLSNALGMQSANESGILTLTAPNAYAIARRTVYGTVKKDSHGPPVAQDRAQ